MNGMKQVSGLVERVSPVERTTLDLWSFQTAILQGSPETQEGQERREKGEKKKPFAQKQHL